jgi:Fe-S cluster biosynthesis and repair protein YggX
MGNPRPPGSDIKDGLRRFKNGNDNNNGNGNGNGNGRYGAYAGYKGVKRKRAANLVDGELKSLMHMLRRELRSGRRELRHEAGDVRQEFRNERQDINKIFGETGEFIGQQNGLIDERFKASNAQAQAAQAALMEQLGGMNSANTGAVGDELGRLGMDMGAFGGQLAADQGYATDMAAISGANNAANLQAMQAASGTMGNMLLGMNEGSKGSMLSANMRNRDEQIGDIRDAKHDFTKDVQQRVLDAKSQRGDMIRSMLEQMAQTGWAQYIDQQNLNQNQQQINMQRRQMQHGFAMDNAYASGSSGSSGTSGSTNDIIANWLAGPQGGTNPQNPQGPRKPKKPQYDIWHPQLAGNYPGSPEDYLP